MASSKTLFGVSYDRHKVVDLKSFLDAVSRPYKSSSTKRTLVSTLIDFEKSLNPTAQATLVDDVQSYYDTKNTSTATRVERNLLRTLRRLSQEQDENNQDEAGEDKAGKNKETGKIPYKTGSQKRKHSEISKRSRKPKKNKPRASKSRICLVCFEDIQNKSFPKVNITTSCEHGNSVCVVCIEAHVNSRIDIGQFGFLTCPMCPEVLGLEDVRRLCGSEIFEKYDRLVTRTALQEDPTFHLCLAPGCGSGQYNDDEGCHKMVCAACQFATCTHHGMAWHRGQTCEEFDRDIEEALTETPQHETPQECKGAEDTERKRQRKITAEDGRQETPDEAMQRETVSREQLVANVLAQVARQEAREQEARKAQKARVEEETRRREARQEARRQEARRQEARRQEARREEAAKQKALDAAKALKIKQATDNKASLAAVKGIAKTCPNERCGAQIEKRGGCDHMTCTRCSREFCWQCLGGWYDGHHQPCPYQQPMYDRFGRWIGAGEHY